MMISEELLLNVVNSQSLINEYFVIIITSSIKIRIIGYIDFLRYIISTPKNLIYFDTTDFQKMLIQLKELGKLHNFTIEDVNTRLQKWCLENL